jgi:molybdopterin/thiamine biosynthesis adenylyltransferase
MNMNNPNDTTLEHTERRLGGVARLYGDVAYAIFQQAHVVVIGLGGVGSWAAEALARSAIGEITLIDYDHVSMSNTNRQLHALDGEFGKSKIEVMAKRLSLINPELKINCIDDFLKPENFQEYLPQGAAILDAMDDVASKLALASWVHQNKVPYVMSGGAGGKLDPSKIEVVDLARTTHDSMLAKIRSSLRQQYGFEKDPKRKMNLRVVYSSEPREGVAGGGLSCAGFGSTVTVTATFGFIAAAEILQQLIDLHKTV